MGESITNNLPLQLSVNIVEFELSCDAFKDNRMLNMFQNAEVTLLHKAIEYK